MEVERGDEVGEMMVDAGRGLGNVGVKRSKMGRRDCMSFIETMGEMKRGTRTEICIFAMRGVKRFGEMASEEAGTRVSETTDQDTCELTSRRQKSG